MDLRIKFKNVGYYSTSDEGNILKIFHPAIILEDKNTNYKIVLPYTSDISKSITKDKNDSRNFIICDMWITSRIQNEESLIETKQYYRNEGRYMFAQKLSVGTYCYHFEKNHKGYITKYCPIFDEKTFPKIREISDTINYYYQAEMCEKYKNAIIRGDIEFYLSSNIEIPSIKIEYIDLFIKNKIDICYKLECYKRWAYNEKPISKDEFIKHEIIPNIKIESEEKIYLEKINLEEEINTLKYEIKKTDTSSVEKEKLTNEIFYKNTVLSKLNKKIEKSNSEYIETLTNLDNKEKMPSYEEKQNDFEDFSDDVE